MGGFTKPLFLTYTDRMYKVTLNVVMPMGLHQIGLYSRRVLSAISQRNVDDAKNN